MVGVYSFGRGLFHKEPVAGNSTSYKFFHRLKADHVVLSQLFGWEGALALSSREFEGLCVSPQFPTFLCDTNWLDRQFLGWLLRRPSFWADLGTRTKGMGDRRRTVSPDAFLSSTIPLPPLAEQQRIVARIEELAAKVEAARALRKQAREEAEMLLVSTLHSVFERYGPPGRWPALSTVVDSIENGWSPACLQRPADEGEWGVLKVGAVSTGQFAPGENKALPLYMEPRRELEIRDGDFLFGRANTKELVGACAVVRNPPRQLMLCDKIFRFVFRSPTRIDKFYLNYVLKSPPLREQIEAGASGTSSSMKNISKSKVMQLRIPLPSFPEQHRIVAYLDDLQARVEAVKAHQAAAAAALDALLPSILDQAFKGEL